MNYQVAEIYDAIQGEGTQAGVPMTIVRLQGCSVGCPWCDTKFSWDHSAGDAMDADAIVESVRAASTRGVGSWILLTGGEPAEQDLVELVATFHREGFKVALETSGTAIGHLAAGLDWVTVSPKAGMPGGRELSLRAIRHADELKFVIGKAEHLDAIPELLERAAVEPGTAIVSIQPLSLSKKATELCIEASKTRGYRLSIQTHRMLDQR